MIGADRASSKVAVAERDRKAGRSAWVGRIKGLEFEGPCGGYWLAKHSLAVRNKKDPGRGAWGEKS